MSYRKVLAGMLLVTLATLASASSPAHAIDFSSLNPFADDKPLGRLTGTIKPPSVSESLKKMNEGTLKVISGTKDIFFPWATAPKHKKLPPPPAPTGTRRVYPASDRPDS